MGQVAEWYTRWSQKPMGIIPVRVQLPPCPPIPISCHKQPIICGDCLKRRKAFKDAGYEDPLEYKFNEGGKE